VPQVNLTTDSGSPVPARVTNIGDQVYRVDFQPTVPTGTIAAAVTFNNQPVPKSPFRVTVQAGSGVDNVVVKDLPECKFFSQNIVNIKILAEY